MIMFAVMDAHDERIIEIVHTQGKAVELCQPQHTDGYDLCWARVRISMIGEPVYYGKRP
jgi:hypothetical protein